MAVKGRGVGEMGRCWSKGYKFPVLRKMSSGNPIVVNLLNCYLQSRAPGCWMVSLGSTNIHEGGLNRELSYS